MAKRKKKAAPAPRVGDLPSSVQAARPEELMPVTEQIAEELIPESTMPAKPKGVAGADWVWENNNWVLKPKDGGTFVTTPEGGLTPAPKGGGGGEGAGVVSATAAATLNKAAITVSSSLFHSDRQCIARLSFA